MIAWLLGIDGKLKKQACHRVVRVDLKVLLPHKGKLTGTPGPIHQWSIEVGSTCRTISQNMIKIAEEEILTYLITVARRSRFAALSCERMQ